MQDGDVWMRNVLARSRQLTAELEGSICQLSIFVVERDFCRYQRDCIVLELPVVSPLTGDVLYMIADWKIKCPGAEHLLPVTVVVCASVCTYSNIFTVVNERFCGQIRPVRP